MNIRPAVPSDAEAILALERASFAVPWSESSIRGDLASNPAAHYLVAVEEGCVVGYIGMWAILDEAQVMDVAVAPAARRRGIGRALVARMIEEARELGLDRILLEVREKNTGAIALYAAMGFESDGLRRGYYPDDGDNAILMSRKIRGRNTECR